MSETEALSAKKKAIIVTGGTGGLGNSIVKELAKSEKDIWIVSVGRSNPTRRERINMRHWNRSVTEICIDLSSSAECEYLRDQLSAYGLEASVLINNAGSNYIAPFEEQNLDMLNELMQVNAFSNVQLTHSVLEDLKKHQGLVLNIVSNAAHQPMSFSTAYNMSKAAQLSATMQMARELRKRFGITVMAISPNKLSGTGMSDYIDQAAAYVNGKTVDEMRQYQLNGLASGKETDIEGLARTIADLVVDRDRWQYLNGCNWEYGR